MVERITGTTTSCLDCPHRHYHDCEKTGQYIGHWMQKGGEQMPKECPLPKWPAFTAPKQEQPNVQD